MKKLVWNTCLISWMLSVLFLGYLIYQDDRDLRSAEKALEIEIRQVNFLKMQNEGMLKELSFAYEAHAKALLAAKGKALK